MSIHTFADMYLDFVNNFLTVGGFADHYGISDKTAELIVETGRMIERLELNQWEGDR